MNLARSGWPLITCLVLSTAYADDTNRHSVVLSAQGDANDNRQWLGRLALPLGDHAWVSGSLGRSEFAGTDATDMRIIGAAAGGGNRTLNAAVAFVRRQGDARFEQQDWSAILNWRGARGGLGADGFLRNASVNGKGFGLHGDFAVTERTNLFAGAMRYRYDFGSSPVTTGEPTLLSPLLGTNAVLAGPWREQAVIERSYRVGAGYRFDRAAVSAQYLHDRIAHSDSVIRTVHLQAELPIAAHWLVGPMIGYSSGGSLGSAGYGGLSLGFSW